MAQDGGVDSIKQIGDMIGWLVNVEWLVSGKKAKYTLTDVDPRFHAVELTTKVAGKVHVSWTHLSAVRITPLVRTPE